MAKIYEPKRATHRSITDPSCSDCNYNIYEPINHFSVAVPPMLSVPHQLVGVPLGCPVTLECHTEAFPTSLNYWTREDGLMIHESKKYKVTSTTGKQSYITNMTLTIQDVQVAIKCFSLFFQLCNEMNSNLVIFFKIFILIKNLHFFLLFLGEKYE